MHASLGSRYIDAIQGIEQQQYSSNGVGESQQNLLYLVQKNYIGPGREELGQHLATLAKVPLLLGMANDSCVSGFRPETHSLLSQQEMQRRPTFAERLALNERMLCDITRMVDAHQTAYIKEQGVFGTNGQGVYRIDRQNGQLMAQVRRTIPLAELIESMTTTFTGASLIEAGHKMHRTANGSTWEIRIISTDEGPYTVVKKAASGEYRNNIHCGGTWQECDSFVAEQLGDQTQDFLRQCHSVAARTKHYTDTLQIELARKLISQSKIREDVAYEQLMRDCFSGTFIVVDIAAVHTPSGLAPRIIETQFECEFPKPQIDEIVENATTVLQVKLNRFRDALRPRA